MENAFSYVAEVPSPTRSKMQGSDGRYQRLSQGVMLREANPDLELDAKTRKVTDKLSESMNIIANEPSLAFFRIQEHVRKCLPQLAETKHEVQDLQQRVQGASFDAEYAVHAVQEMHNSASHFSSMQDLLKNCIFFKQQIDYEQSRREQKKTNPSMYSTISSPDICSMSGSREFESLGPATHRRRHSRTRSRDGARVKRVRGKDGGVLSAEEVIVPEGKLESPPATNISRVDRAYTIN